LKAVANADAVSNPQAHNATFTDLPVVNIVLALATCRPTEYRMIVERACME
jgi:hypothetical protein